MKKSPDDQISIRVPYIVLPPRDVNPQKEGDSHFLEIFQKPIKNPAVTLHFLSHPGLGHLSHVCLPCFASFFFFMVRSHHDDSPL